MILEDLIQIKYQNKILAFTTFIEAKFFNIQRLSSDI